MSAVFLTLYLLPALTLPHVHLIEHRLIDPTAFSLRLGATSVTPPTTLVRWRGAGGDAPEVNKGWAITGSVAGGVLLGSAALLNVIALNGTTPVAAIAVFVSSIGGAFAGYHLGLSSSTGAKVTIIIAAIVGMALMFVEGIAIDDGFFNPANVDVGTGTVMRNLMR